MPLTNMTDMLRAARSEKYAVGAFNILDFNSMRAVIEAAEDLESPVIVQTSEKTVKLWGFRSIMNWIRDLADKTNIPVAIHLDHCKNIDFIKACIDSGWTSVMIDASSLPFEKNIELSRKVVEMAHPYGISVEAELGEIGGVEDDIAVEEKDAHMVNPQKAKVFLEEVNMDCFAPAIGTAHGIYKGEPRVDFDRLKEISHISQIPLALHGGTGLSEAVFKRSIALGCAKINISTQLKYAFIDGFVNYHKDYPDEYNPLNVINAQFSDLKEVILENIKLFGSAKKVN